ncbi:MAG: hypothetical protein PHX08_23245 [Lachnospiraceae bacterium]|nr:hypothetical protein [Lachnospiraceae bacterium]
MKRIKSISFYLLFIPLIILPFGTMLSAFCGYRFELGSYLAFALATIIVAIVTVVLNVVEKEKNQNKMIAGLMMPLALINVVFYLYQQCSIWIALSLFISVGCCCYLTLSLGGPKAFKIFTLALSVIITLPIGFVCFILLIFGNIGKNSVVQSVQSPNGAYYAEIIDSNQGALGGGTFVDVYKKDALNLLLFKIADKPQRVFSGDWGEFTDMELYWKNDNCLIINGVGFSQTNVITE